MKTKRFIRIKAGFLALVMACVSLSGTVPVYAEELFETEVAAVMFIEETFEDTETAPETEAETLSEPETAEELPEENGGLVENSFRYYNGEWLHNEVTPFALPTVQPWSFYNGSWVNFYGDPIEGAIEKGIDVSTWQGKIDWEKVAASDVTFAVIRCGYGDNLEYQDDSRWKYNADECTRLGIPFGVYIYSYALNTEAARKEAEHVLRLVKGYNLSLPIYLDLEDEKYTGSLSNAEIADIAQVFCDTIEAAGYDVGIYANLYWFRNRLTDPRFDQWTHWVAQYNYQCDYAGNYSMWQCTSTGYVDGIEGPVDLNFIFENAPSRLVEVRNFVTRLYERILNRKPDMAGLKDWSNRLLSQEETGAQVAWGFIMSDEFTKQKLSDDAYVEILYQTFLNRSSDKAGKADWLEQLATGFSREYVLRGFAESDEFQKICDSYGILRGNISLSDTLDRNPNITRFVYRNYKEFLGRKPDRAGQLDWVTQLATWRKTPGEVAFGFVFSNELGNKQLTDEAFVKILYNGLFGRNADAWGLADWTNRLRSGNSREDVFWGFVGSDEFNTLVKSFGL